MDTFMGYGRENGDVGARNHVAIIPSVVCANEVAKRIEERVENARAFLHHQGCIQMGKDLEMTRRSLVGFGSNPNCHSVLVVSLGCEAVDPQRLADEISRTGKNVEVVGIQKENGTLHAIDKGVRIAREMSQAASTSRGEEFDVSNLTVGIKCGASDTTSGVASNPATGQTADRNTNKRDSHSPQYGATGRVRQQFNQPSLEDRRHNSTKNRAETQSNSNPQRHSKITHRQTVCKAAAPPKHPE